MQSPAPPRRRRGPERPPSGREEWPDQGAHQPTNEPLPERERKQGRPLAGRPRFVSDQPPEGEPTCHRPRAKSSLREQAHPRDDPARGARPLQRPLHLRPLVLPDRRLERPRHQVGLALHRRDRAVHGRRPRPQDGSGRAGSHRHYGGDCRGCGTPIVKGRTHCRACEEVAGEDDECEEDCERNCCWEATVARRHARDAAHQTDTCPQCGNCRTCSDPESPDHEDCICEDGETAS